MIIYGVDFSSAPTKQKPIVIAECRFDSCNNYGLNQSSLLLRRFVCIYSLNDFEVFLSKSKFGVGGFDLPFSMPKELIEYFEWPNEWENFVRYFCGKSKSFLKDCFKSWCEKRDFGKKFAYRLTDLQAKSSPAMRWVNPPVAWMMHAGIHRLINAGLIFPAHDRNFKTKTEHKLIKSMELKGIGYNKKLALEVYPALTARKVTNKSYKSDEKVKNNCARIGNRKDILKSLRYQKAGLSLDLKISLHDQKKVVEDFRGDYLDAVICAMQAADAIMDPFFRFPKSNNYLEGWIVGSDD